MFTTNKFLKKAGKIYKNLCSMKYLQETCLVKLTSSLIEKKA